MQLIDAFDFGREVMLRQCPGNPIDEVRPIRLVGDMRLRVDALDDARELPVAEGDVEVDLREIAPGALRVASDLRAHNAGGVGLVARAVDTADPLSANHLDIESAN